MWQHTVVRPSNRYAPVVITPNSAQTSGARAFLEEHEACTMASEPPAKAQRTTTIHLRNEHACPPYLIEQRQEKSCHADATIETSDGKSLRAHRCVLAGSSDYFRGLFGSGLADSLGTIALDLPAAAVEAMLAFVYEGDCPVDEESLVPLLEAASYLQIKALEEMLRSEIVSRLVPAKCLDLLEHARARTLPELEAAIWRRLPALVEMGCGLILRSAACACLTPEDSAKLLQLAVPFLKRTIVVTGMPASTMQARSTKRHKEQVVRDLFDSLAPPGLELLCNADCRSVRLDFTIGPEFLVSSSSTNSTASYEYGHIMKSQAIRVQLVPGFPKPFSWGGLTLEHFQVEIDRGYVFDEALATLEAHSEDVGAGFYKAARAMMGREAEDRRMFAMLVPRPYIYAREVWEVPLYDVLHPATGWGKPVTLAEFTDGGRNFKVTPDEATRSGWTQIHTEALTTCLHGPHCRHRHGCTVGKRIGQRIDMLVGPCLPLWHALLPPVVSRRTDLHLANRLGLRLEIPAEECPFVTATILGEAEARSVNGMVIDREKLSQLECPK